LIFRELTKINEELVVRPIVASGPSGGIVAKGEFTVVVGQIETSQPDQAIDQLTVNRLFDLLLGSGLVPEANIAASVAAAFDMKLPAAMKAAKKGKILAKRQSEAAP
jgi:16S rRNA C1402 (ribose-2'-O) methylase RsmI